ncbi:MAG: ROK family protein [Blastocatellia bacterium]
MAAAKKPAKKRTTTKTAPKPTRSTSGPKTLAFDIGGSGLKASVLDDKGNMITERIRIETPQPCPPAVLLEKFKEMVVRLPAFDRVSVGFPGVVRKGRTLTYVNLGADAWRGFDLRGAIAKITGKPAVVINDADMQGLGAIKGTGVELVITLGTGVGSALFEDGRLAPHLELAHIPFRKGQTFEQQLGNRAFRRVGPERWNKRLARAIEIFRTLTNFDKLYLGGGNAENVTLEFGKDIELTSNSMGMKGGIWLWKDSNLNDGVQK